MRTFLTIVGMFVGLGLLFIGAAIGSMLGAGGFIVILTGHRDIELWQATVGLVGGMAIALGGIGILLYSLKKATVLAKRIFFGSTFSAMGGFMMWMSVVYMPGSHPITVIMFLLGAGTALMGVIMAFFGSRERIEIVGR